MKKTLLFIVLLLSFALNSALADDSVTVSASSEVRVSSSETVINITLQERGASVSEVNTALSVKKSQVQSAISSLSKTALKFESRGISVTRERGAVSSTKMGGSSLNPAEVIANSAVQLTEVLAVSVGKFSLASKMADAALKKGALSVKFDFKTASLDKAFLDAIAEATRGAKKKAEAIAVETGAVLGAPISIEVVEEAPGAILRKEMQLGRLSPHITEHRMNVYVTARYRLNSID